MPRPTLRTPLRLDRPKPLTRDTTARDMPPEIPANAPPGLLLQLGLQAKQRAGANLYVVGEVIERVHAGRLWPQLGYATFEELLEKTQLAGRSTAYKLMAIVRSNPRPAAFARGIEQAFSMFRFSMRAEELLNAVGVDMKTLVGDIDVENLSVRDRDELTRRIEDLLDADDAEVDDATPAPPPSPPLAPHTPKTALARKLQKALRDAGAEGGIVGSFNKNGAPWLRIKIAEAHADFVDPRQ